ncbi:MAG: hydrolase [Pseudonocardiales bacterium]|nr:hydrolase [Pseudonocardiales bacterium]
MSEPQPPSPPAIRPAATVILLRDGVGGLETWMLRRVRQMAFAGGMSVFPGGAVDASDAAAEVPWVGDEPTAVAARFVCSLKEARASLVAATRETFEETGVLLTRPFPSGEAFSVGPLSDLRRAVENRETNFATMLVTAGLSVDANLIRPWAHWITPPQESRRFDTHFYVALLPEGVEAQADSGEAVHAEWVRPTVALAQFQAGERPMMPPTVMTLKELGEFERAADVLAASAGRELRPVRPTIESLDDGTRRLALPDGTVFIFPARPTPPAGPTPPDRPIPPAEAAQWRPQE